jgi:hypothetical protein
MDSIQRLRPGSRITLIGGIEAQVEKNPRDGVWLLAKVPAVSAPSKERVETSFAESPHGTVCFTEPGSADLFLYVHADDIV